jgi:hypothetical protein
MKKQKFAKKQADGTVVPFVNNGYMNDTQQKTCLYMSFTMDHDR